MKKLWIIGVLAIFMIMPNVNATCEIYDDFSSGTLDTNKWVEIIATDMGTGMIDEHYVIDGVYHTAQVNIGDGGTALVFKDMTFKYGDIIEYDVNYISGSGNRISTIMLNGDAYSTAFLGWWNTLSDGGNSNEYGIHHVKLTFLGLEGVKVELDRPNGDYHTWITVPSKWGYAPTEEYVVGIVTRTGHNGLVHMDYDNVVICTDTTEEIPEFGSIILVTMMSLAGFGLFRYNTTVI